MTLQQWLETGNIHNIWDFFSSSSMTHMAADRSTNELQTTRFSFVFRVDVPGGSSAFLLGKRLKWLKVFSSNCCQLGQTLLFKCHIFRLLREEEAAATVRLFITGWETVSKVWNCDKEAKALSRSVTFLLRHLYCMIIEWRAQCFTMLHINNFTLLRRK